MSKETNKEASRVAVAHRDDGVHLSTIFGKIVSGFDMSLEYISALNKNHAKKIHAGRASSTKSLNNTYNNLMSSVRDALSGQRISFCTLMTMFRVLRIDSLKIEITVKRGDEEVVVNHDIVLKESKPKSEVWDD